MTTVKVGGFSCTWLCLCAKGRSQHAKHDLPLLSSSGVLEGAAELSPDGRLDVVLPRAGGRPPVFAGPQDRDAGELEQLVVVQDVVLLPGRRVLSDRESSVK